MEYLNALRKKNLIRRIQGAPAAFIMLDYDGTLSPIAAAPELAKLPESTRSLLEALSKSHRYSVAIITGRTIREMRSLVKVPGIIYAGNHGLELEGPEFSFMHAQGKLYERTMEEIWKDLQPLLKEFPGSRLEDKGISLSFHFRLLDGRAVEQFYVRFKKKMAPWIEGKKVQVLEAKKVFEIRPRVNWNKGSAVQWILLHEDPEALPVYIGDDKPDEPAFRALRDRGITVRVGFSPDSSAQYFVQDTEEVERFLSHLVVSGGRS